METCWCLGTKRELVIPNFMTKSRAMADMESYFRCISELAELHDKKDK